MKRDSLGLIAAIVFGIATLVIYMQGVSDAEHKTPTAPPEFLSMENPVPLTDDVLASAKKLYKKRCKKCHGSKGNGRGPGTKGMDPKPRDYTDKAAMSKIPDGQLFWIILNGSEGTEMKAWKEGKAKPGKEISEEQAWKLVHYIRQFAK